MIKFIYSAFSLFAFACFAFVPRAQAVTPAPDGCYPNYTTAEGCNALQFLGAGVGNTGIGWYSLFLAGDANFNTGVGGGALALNTADSNTAVGAGALLLNTTDEQNVAVGTDALVLNDSGSFNNAVGAFALFNNTTGSNNTATGQNALLNNTTGFNNTATGLETLVSNNGNNNTATGIHALYSNTTGNENTSTGVDALFNNTEGNDNTAAGKAALFNNATGDANVAVGWFALINNVAGTNNTAVGAGALQNNISNGNIALGTNAGANLTAGQFNIDIGNEGVSDEGNTIRIGDANQTATFIAGIRDVTTGVADAIPVVIESAGQLGTMSSSKRFKKDIRPMDNASESVLALEPVRFQYKRDSKGTPQFGLIAEEVAKVNPDLVVRDHKGEIYSVRYEAVNAMLLNEFLKEHRKVQEQEATIARLKSTMVQQTEAVTAHLKEHDAQIQKVSAQAELNKPAPQTVLNNQ